MPKIVDHEQRRAELAEAVWRVVGREGVEGATVRAVAAEAGWSMGALRYYFSTQDGLLLFAVERMGRRLVERVRPWYADVREGEAPDLDRATRMLCELLPLDDERRVEVLVWLAFMTRARISGDFDEARRGGWVGERFLCRLAIADALGLELPRQLEDRLPGDDLEQDAADLHVRVDGLSLQGVTYPEHWPPDALARAVRTCLEDISARHPSV